MAFRRRLWHKSLDELEGDEFLAAMTALIYVHDMKKRIRLGLKYVKVRPRWGRKHYEAVVAKVCIPWFMPTDDPQDLGDRLFDASRNLRDINTCIAGSPMSRSPYGDLLYRVLQGAGVVVDGHYAQWFGHPPELPVGVPAAAPPELRNFFDEVVRRFAAAVRLQDNPKWHTMDGFSILSDLRSNPGKTTRLVNGVFENDNDRLAVHLYGKHWILPVSELFDGTQDEKLAEGFAYARDW